MAINNVPSFEPVGRESLTAMPVVTLSGLILPLMARRQVVARAVQGG